MNYNSELPKLEQMALIKTAIILWNQNDIKVLLHTFYESLDSLDFNAIFDSPFRNWRQIEKEVNEKIMLLSQPRLLREKISSFIETVGSQMSSWMEYHRFISPHLYMRSEFCWTPYGTIDVKKTAEVLIKDRNLDINSRFMLACVYCFESDIPALWRNLPETFRMGCEKNPMQNELVGFWTLVMKNEVCKMTGNSYQISINQYAFEIAVKVSSRAAVEYFLKKMNPRQREESLLKYARSISAIPWRYDSKPFKEIRADVLLFLFLEMDERGKREVLKNHASYVLECFLYWPRQGLFMETVNSSWEFLSSSDFARLAVHILKKVDYKDYNYQKLFGEVWSQSQDSHKSYFMNSCAPGENMLLCSILKVFFLLEDGENISLILNNLSPIQKKRIIFSAKGKRICNRLYSEGKWDLLKFFIGECVSSKNVHLKEELKSCLNAKENLDKFDQLMHELHKDDEEDRMSE